MDRSRWKFRLYQVRVFLPCVDNCRADVEHDPPTIASFAESISPTGVNFRDYRSLTGMGLMNTKYARSHSRFRISKGNIKLSFAPFRSGHFLILHGLIKALHPSHDHEKYLLDRDEHCKHAFAAWRLCEIHIVSESMAILRLRQIRTVNHLTWGALQVIGPGDPKLVTGPEPSDFAPQLVELGSNLLRSRSTNTGSFHAQATFSRQLLVILIVS